MSTLSDFAASTLVAAQANTLAGAQRLVSDWNNVLTQKFLNAFANWALSITSGKSTDTSNPPQPPKAFVVGYFTDPTSGPGTVGPYGEMPVQWAYPAQGKDPVCDMPPIPGVVKHADGIMLIGTQNPSAPEWFNALPDDVTPVGTTAPGTSKDGIPGLFKKFGGITGSHGGYFLKIG